MATALSPVAGLLAGVITGATPSPVSINATTVASGNWVALTAGTNVLFSFANNGNAIVVIYNTAGAGGCTWSPTIYPTTAGAIGGPGTPLGVSIPLTAMVITTPSTIGAYILGPFGPSKFADSNGLSWLTQVTASAATSYIGVFANSGALT